MQALFSMRLLLCSIVELEEWQYIRPAQSIYSEGVMELTVNEQFPHASGLRNHGNWNAGADVLCPLQAQVSVSCQLLLCQLAAWEAHCNFTPKLSCSPLPRLDIKFSVAGSPTAVNHSRSSEHHSGNTSRCRVISHT